MEEKHRFAKQRGGTRQCLLSFCGTNSQKIWLYGNAKTLCGETQRKFLFSLLSESNKRMATLKEKTAKGLLWGGMNNGVQQLVGLVFGIILGRLLSPADYGMMAMISIFSLVATTLQNSGFSTALSNLKAPTPRDYNAVFWFNIAVGVALYLLLFFCAPLIGNYYHTERIVPLCQYAFLSIVIASLGTAQSAYLFKNMRAKQQAKAAMAAVVLSSITGAVMAWKGMAYWSLATQGLVYVSLNTLLVWHYSPWRPTLRGISFAPIRKMFNFSVGILATGIITHISNNVLNIMLGHYFTAKAAGNYNQAYQWNTKCFSLVQNMVNQVAQPVLVDLREDAGRQLNAFRKLIRFTAFITFPLLFGFGLVAREFIVLAITEKWLESAQLIQILCISGATVPLSALLSNIIISKERSDLYFIGTFSLCVAQVVTMFFIWRLGIHAMVLAYTALNVLWLTVWLGFAKRLAGYRLRSFLKDTLPFALAAATIAVGVHFATAQIHHLILLLVTRLLLAAALYVLLMKAARVKILDECAAFIKSKIPTRGFPLKKK